MTGGGRVEGRGEVTAQGSQRLTVNCGPFKQKEDRSKRGQFVGELLHQIIPVRKDETHKSRLALKGNTI